LTDTPLDLARPVETLLAEGGFAETTVQPGEATCTIQAVLVRGIAGFHDEKSGSRLAAPVGAL